MWLLNTEGKIWLERVTRGEFKLTDSQILAASAAGASQKKSSQVDGNQAVIPIRGILSERFNMLAHIFGDGSTAYRDIVKQAQEADADPAIDSIRLHVTTSPGGSVNGLFSAIQALRALKTPITAAIENMAASATYILIASVAREITAVNPGTMVGSVGVRVDMPVDVEGQGFKTITNTDSPDKVPDVATPEGEALVRAELDEIHDYVVKLIGEGRGLKSSVVRSEFGQGAMMLAGKALKAGMVDKIGTVKKIKSTVTGKVAEGVGANIGGVKMTLAGLMTLAELMAQHPELYAEAVAHGRAEERDRAVAHLQWVDAGADVNTVVEAVKNGDPLSQSLMSAYQIAAIGKQAQISRVADNPSIKVDSSTSAVKDEEDVIADLVAEHVGLVDEPAPEVK